MLSFLFLIGIVLVAAFAQTLSGFGFALVMMPLLTLLVGVQTAAPLVALTAFTLYTVNFIHYHRVLLRGELVRVGLAGALGVPIGIWVIVHVSDHLVKLGMGIFLIAYAVFDLARPTVMQVIPPTWGYLAGFVAGILGGAYNTPGPPLVVYGSLRHWPRAEFRGMLQTSAFLTGGLTVVSHLAAQHVTPSIWLVYLALIPALFLGRYAGLRVDRHINHQRFRLLVAAMIVVLGISLVADGLRA